MIKLPVLIFSFCDHSLIDSIRLLLQEYVIGLIIRGRSFDERSLGLLELSRQIPTLVEANLNSFNPNNEYRSTQTPIMF